MENQLERHKMDNKQGNTNPQLTATTEDQFYKIGRIGKTHGVKGEIQMQVDDDIFDRVESDYVMLMVDGLLVPFFMEEYRFKSDEIALVKFCDIETNERARQLTGCDVYFPRGMKDEDDDVVTWAEIIGYTLIDEKTKSAVGTIADVDDATENVLIVLSDDTLIPVADELITDIDHAKQTITLNIPEGILNL